MLGRDAEAAARREATSAMMDEMANTFSDPQLRDLYLQKAAAPA